MKYLLEREDVLLNRDRAVRMMEECGVDALVATLPENVYYFTGYAGWICRAYKEWQRMPGGSYVRPQAYAVLTREEAAHPALIAPILNANYAAQNQIWVRLEDIQTYGRFPGELRPGIKVRRPEELRFEGILDATERNSPTAGQALVKALKEGGLEKARIGLDTENISPAVWGTLRKDLPQSDVRDACEVFRFIRMVKSPVEVERLSRAAQLNEDARGVFLEFLKLGVTEREMLQVYKEYVTKHGGIYEFLNCPTGTRSGGFFPPSDYRLRKGDVMWYDFGCIVNHYHADLGNTAVLGKPTKEQAALYDAVVTGMQAALDTVQPSVKPSEVAAAANDVLEKRGLQPHTAGFVHGVGLEIRDHPLHAPVNPEGISDGFVKPRSTDIPLEEGMVINIEVPHRIFGFAAAQIEYTLLVTKAGYELVCPQPRELYIVPT